MDFICPHTCSYRTSSGYCGSTGGWERCQYRQLHQPNTVVGYVPPLKKTNADRIRAMTDEELAELLTDVAQKSADKLCESLKTVEVDLSNCNFHILYEAHLDWLKQEVGDDA